MRIEDILLDKALKENASLVSRVKALEFFKRTQNEFAICLQGNYTIKELEAFIEHLRDIENLNGPKPA